MELKDDATKNYLFELCPVTNAIVVGDFNGRIGKEGILDTIVGKFSSNDAASPKGLRMVSFAGVILAKNIKNCIKLPRTLQIEKGALNLSSENLASSVNQ